jgi:hypothetical protein
MSGNFRLSAWERIREITCLFGEFCWAKNHRTIDKTDGERGEVFMWAAVSKEGIAQSRWEYTRRTAIGSCKLHDNTLKGFRNSPMCEILPAVSDRPTVHSFPVGKNKSEWPSLINGPRGNAIKVSKPPHPRPHVYIGRNFLTWVEITEMVVSSPVFENSSGRMLRSDDRRIFQ